MGFLAEWNELQSKPEFWEYSPKDREAIKAQWFQERVATTPDFQSLPPEDQQFVSQDFLKPDQHVGYDRGFVGDVGSRLARGGLGLLEAAGGAMRMTDMDPTEDTGLIPSAGKKLTDFAESARQDYDVFKPDIAEASGQEGFVKRGVGGTLESLIPSAAPLAAAIAGGRVGGLLGSAFGPAGAIVGAGLGATIGGAVTLFATFGAGEYQRTYDDTVKELTEKGVGPEDAAAKANKNALISATAEVGGEAIGDIAFMSFFGVFGGQAAKQPLKQTIKQILGAGPKAFATAVAKAMPFEVGSEVGTAYFQSKAAQEAGVSTMPPGEAMAESVLPAILMSLIFGFSIHGMNSMHARKIYNGLNDDDSQVRAQAADIIAGRIKDPEAKATWQRTAAEYLESGKQIPISKPIVDFATQKVDGEAPSSDINDIASAQNVDDAVNAFNRAVSPEVAADPLFQARQRNQGIIDSTFINEQPGRESGLLYPKPEAPTGITFPDTSLDYLMPNPTGEVPGMGVDQDQQRKEMARRLGLPEDSRPYNRPALPESTGGPPSPIYLPAQPEQVKGPDPYEPPKFTNWTRVADKAGLLESERKTPESPAEPAPDRTEYWNRIRKQYGFEETGKPVTEKETAEFEAWRRKAASGGGLLGGTQQPSTQGDASWQKDNATEPAKATATAAKATSPVVAATGGETVAAASPKSEAEAPQGNTDKGGVPETGLVASVSPAKTEKVKEPWERNTDDIKNDIGADRVYIDNPGGSWLEDERQNAKIGKGGGSKTAGVENVTVPVDVLLGVDGRLGEHNRIKADDKRVLELAQKIEKEGFTSLPFVNVEWDGTANINEGNHRIRAAKKAGIKNIPVEIAYFAGGERAEGPFSFRNLLEYRALVKKVTPEKTSPVKKPAPAAAAPVEPQAKPETKKEKADREYKEWIDALSDGDRLLISDEIKASPKNPASYLYKLKKTLGQKKKSAEATPKEQAPGVPLDTTGLSDNQLLWIANAVGFYTEKKSIDSEKLRSDIREDVQGILDDKETSRIILWKDFPKADKSASGKAPEREPWTMTKREFQLSRAKAAGGVPILNARDGDIHKNAVELAVNQGQDVPERVLKDYPWLKQEPKTKFPADRVMGTKVDVAMQEEVDGVSFELYKPEDEINDKSGFTLVRNVETGDVLEIKKYPTIRQATDAHIDQWTKASKMSEKQKEPTKDKSPDGKTGIPQYGTTNKIFTKESADAARVLLLKKLNQVNTGLDPEIVQAGIQLAGYHIEAGARSFAAYTKAMIDDLGDAVKPYLRGWYEAVRYYPGFNNDGMTKPENIDEDSLTDIEDEPNNKDEDIEEKGAQDGTIRNPTERTPERKPKEPVSGTEKGESAGPVLPGTGRGSREGTARNDSDRDAGLHGRGSRDKEAVSDVDYTITTNDDLGVGGPKQKFKNNVAAIRTLKKLGPRKATPEEQAILVKYVGWGGLPQAFPKPNGQVSNGWGSEVEELQDLLSADEYAAARKSTQDSHYTSDTVVSKIYDAVKRFGFKQGKILEPSVGTGNFIGLMPGAIRGRSTVTGIELDPTTAAIAEKLYPNQRIVNLGFEAVTIAPGSFDVAIGNPPFGDKKLFDPKHPEFKNFSIHNFFFAKSLVGLRPNGILSMVVSSSMMDKRGTEQRRWLSDRTELIGAIRLPSSAFKSNAGTEVTTDIVFLRKLMDGETAPDTNKWISLKPITAEDGTQYLVNEYFADNPDMVLGRPVKNKLHPSEVVDGVYGGVAGFDAVPGVDLREALDAAISFLPKDIYQVGQTMDEVQRPDIIVSDVGFAQPFGYTIDDQGNAVRRLPDVNGEQVFEPVLYSGKPIEGKRLERFKGILEIRDAVRTLIRAEIEDADSKTLDKHRKHLNTVYDNFVKENGYISTPANSSILKQDPTDLPLLRSLETKFDAGVSAAVARRTGEKARPPKAEKSAIFTTRTREPYRKATKAANAKDGLAIVLRENGFADIDRIAELTGKTVDATVKELGDLIFQNPVTEGYETPDIYLSGNVKKKLKQAMNAVSQDPLYQKNVAALEKVLPKDVPIDKIHFEIGATWIPTNIYEDFSREVLERDASVVYAEDVGVWSVSVARGASPYDSPGKSAGDIFSDLLKSRDIVCYDTIDKKRVLNKEDTVAAQQKAKEINAAFQEWVLNDFDRRDVLESQFNEKVNTTIDGKFSGDHMIFPGMGIINSGVKRDNQLLSHQKNVVWRLVQKGKGLVDHVVGSGKTFLSIAAGLEMKRMGLLKKPMYVVPNHLVGQWAMDFQRLYPGANVLVINKKDFSKKNRQEFMGRIATGEWDAVVIAHSSFGFIKMPADYERRFYEVQVAEYEAAITALAEEEGKKSRTVKQMEAAKDKLVAKMQALANKPKDATVDFSELGVDGLFVDEAHEFKNLFYATKRQRVAGLGNQQGSKKAFDLFVKTQFIQENNNGKGVFFLTGTPVSNSISEMFTMMRYLEYDRMKEMGIRHFDQWANMFASPVSDWEVDPTGTRYRLQTKMDFVNIPGLTAFYKDFADVVSTDDLKQWAKERNEVWPIPDVEGGKPESVVAEKSDLQSSFMSWIVHRFDNMPKDPKEDNPLKATGEAMKASLDIRLINPSLPDNPGSKVNLAVDRILDTYKKWKDRNGTQLVFCDLSVPSKSRDKHTAEIAALKKRIKDTEDKLSTETDEDRLSEIEEEYTKLTDKLEKYSPAELMAAESSFSVYDDIKAKLLANGIPENEVAFIHDANTDLQKEDLFSRVRNGRVRVLIGSTSKMGAGMNVQNRLVALHHLDAPWRPSDLEQREGRIIRQGNEFYQEALKDGKKFAVSIYRYATKETLDTRRWQIIERKAKTIEQLRSGDVQWGETITDTTGEAANAAEMKAAASGNPLILEEIQTRKDLEKLELEKRSDRSRRMTLEAKIRKRDKHLNEYDGLKKTIAEEVRFIEEHPRDNTPEGWSATVDGNEYRAKGLVSVPEQYTGEDAEKRKSVDKAIKEAEKHNADALKSAKEAFGKGIKKALIPYLVRNTQNTITGPSVKIRGVHFNIVRDKFSNWIDFRMDLASEPVYTGNTGSRYSPTYQVDEVTKDGISTDGLLVRLNNALDKIVADRYTVERRMQRIVEESKREAGIAERELKKEPFDDTKIDAARKKHTDILNQLQSSDSDQDQETPDFSMWTDKVFTRQTPQTQASGQYYEFNGEDAGYMPATGAKKVDIVPWAETFVRKITSGSSVWWSVTEATTGLRAAKDNTRKGAIEKAKSNLENAGETALKGMIDAHVEKHGASPWKTGKPSGPFAVLSNDLGSSQLATDVYNFANGLVQQGIKTFRQFRARMFNKFKRIWDKIKPHLRTMWGILNNEGGFITLRQGRDEDTRTHSYQETLEDVTDDDYAEVVKARKNVKAEAVTAFARARGEVKEGLDRFLGSISSRLGAVSEKLKAKVRRLDYDVNKLSNEDIDKVLPLVRKARKAMTKDEYAQWDYARKNSDVNKINELVAKYGLEDEYRDYRNVLDNLRREGIDTGLVIGEIDEYAPRILKDPRGFLTAIGKDPEWPQISRRIKERADEIGINVDEMTTDQKAEIVHQMILGGDIGLGGVQSAKHRKLKKIPAYLNRYYMDSDAALMRHIFSMRKAIESRKFFGKIPKKVASIRTRLNTANNHLAKVRKEMRTAEGADLAALKRRRNKLFGLVKQYEAYLEKYALQRDFRDNIGAYIVDLITAGEITPSQERVVREVLTARFHEMGAHGLVQAYKNLAYIDTMGSPISALTQIGDLAWSAYEGGMIPALINAYKSATGSSRITKEDVGITRVAQEFEDAGELGKAVSKVFKWVGLEKMDAIGKESLLNTAYGKYRKRARSNPDALKTEIRPIFGAETDSVIDDLVNDEITDNVKLLVYSRLADFQPVALSEMPEKYLTAGNGRLFYMLKTFTIKQFDVYRNEIYRKIKNGDRAEKIQGMNNLVRLGMFFVIANAGADEIKDLVLGRKTDLQDRTVDNLLRLAGLSKYYTWQARTEGPAMATLKMILPPVKFIDSAAKDIMTAGDDKGLEIVGSVPVVGKLAYWHMGRGVSKRDDLWDRRLKMEKRSLNAIKQAMEESPTPGLYRSQHRRELLRLDRANALQGQLNKYRRAINELKREGGNEEKIERLKEKRINLIKRFLGRQE